MKNNLLGVLAASMFALPAWADNGHGSGSGSAPTSSASSSATGGAGGAGGAATGGAANGGSATGGTSTVSVSVSVPTGTGGGGGSATTASPGAAEVGAVGAPGSSAYNTSAYVGYGGSYTVKSVPSVLSPSLTATLSDTCMGSASFGLSVVGFGATGGTTVVDDACVRRLDSREFRAMGMADVALALLCQSEANRKAVESTGRACPGVAKLPEVTTSSVSLAQPVQAQASAPAASAPPPEARMSSVSLNQPEVTTPEMSLAPMEASTSSSSISPVPEE